MKCLHALLVASLVAAGFPATAGQAAKPAGASTARDAQATPPAVRAGSTDAFKQIHWEDLVPKGWDPMKGVNALPFAALRDGDPKAMKALDDLKKAWDNAPTEPSMDNARIRIPGFVVPLDGEGGALREFLLVPYFGACIHTPPPPANQVIHVTLAKPNKDIHMMDAIWVSGLLRTAISDTGMGTAGYRMQGMVIAPYEKQR